MDDFKISVVIPVYNSEKYLQETLDSVESQTVGMSEIQVVLVNDGSRDGSADICQAFKAKYPDNVVFVDKSNEGVSVARNVGLSKATGEIVTFLDSDDLWTEDSFEEVLAFFEKPENNVDLVCSYTSLFEGATGDHALSYRFKHDSIITIRDRPCDLQSIMGNCFFKRDALQGIAFDEDISISEDTLFITEVILKKCAYGASSKSHYLHRKRADNSSLSQSVSFEYHMQNLEVCKRLFERSVAMYGEVLPFVQAVAVYVLCWQVLSPVDGSLTEVQKAEWDAAVADILDTVDLSFVTSAPWLSFEKKIVLYRLKYGANFFDQILWFDKDRGAFRGNNFIGLHHQDLFHVYSVSEESGQLVLEGTTNLSVFGHPFLLYAADEKGAGIYEAEMRPYPKSAKLSLTGEPLFEKERFRFHLPLKPGCAFAFKAHFEGCDTDPVVTPRFGNFAIFQNSVKGDYHVFGKVMVKHIGKTLRTYKASAKMLLASEARRCRYIADAKNVPLGERLSYVGLRLLYHLSSIFLKKPVWVFSDKEWEAGDNAENVFRYAVKESGFRDAKMVYALKKSSPDYGRVKAYGTVVDPDSFRYKLLFLRCGVMISSRVEGSVVNPYGARLAFVKDLEHFRLVYLTHGTLFGDLTGILGKPVSGISLFSVSTEMERRALVGDDYGYDEGDVALLGMARYDAFENAKPQRKIAFLPTWRLKLAGRIVPGTTTREYVPNFKSTDYWAFYNSLINDERLLEAMRRNGFTGEFYVHPSFEKQAADFSGNDVISVGESVANYEKVLGESALLVTDYSGVAFDFGYQRKPVVYSQYDSVFGGEHSYGDDTYFDYRVDGFGPVATTVDEVVDAVIGYMERDCAMENEYRIRAEKLFGYDDFANSKRIFEEVAKRIEDGGL